MLKLWVKSVNNLRKLDCTICGYSSTDFQHKLYNNIIRCINTVVYNPHLPYGSTHEYTGKSAKLYLMNKSFTHFPQDLLINPRFININLISRTAKR